MGPFLKGFTNELIKLSAFPQHHQDLSGYDATSAVQGAMDKYQGPQSAAGLKAGVPIHAAPAQKKRAPTPLTTPNHMTDYASRT